MLDFKRNEFSQNGEDGIIEELFRRIGLEARTCCEFGAWDGTHLSNCRRLIQQEWHALMIEAMDEKFKVLVRNFHDNPRVTCVNRLVDDDKNSLGAIIKETGFPGELDFLSVDIDGLDYEIYSGLNIRPRVICIEVNAAHAPDADLELSRDLAATSVGQPMEVFMRIARAKGYSLVCYSGNAFFVRDDIVRQHALEIVTPVAAYESYLKHLESPAREWMYLVTHGLIRPHRFYHNSRVTFQNLDIKPWRCIPMILLAAKMFLLHLKGFLQARLSRGKTTSRA